MQVYVLSEQVVGFLREKKQEQQNTILQHSFISLIVTFQNI